MGVAIAMGGMALASGVMGAFGASSQASAQAMAQEIQQRNENFRRQWANDSENRQKMVQFQANLEMNSGIEQAANKERAISEMFLDQDFLNKKGTLSKEADKVNAAFLGTMNTRGVSTSSGSARAILRQNMEVMGSTMIVLKKNYTSSMKDIEAQQQGRLSNRKLDYIEQTAFMPQRGGIVDGSNSALVTGLIQAGIGAASAGVQGQMEYGKPGTWLNS
jgi:hypothetical protein